MKDYYKILGVSKDASAEEIRKAYHKLAHKYHPDKGGDEKKFKEINEAYQVLSNKERRAQYDKFGHIFGSGIDQGQEGFSSGWGFSSNFSSTWQDFVRGKEFEFDFGELGNLFEEIFGFGTNASQKRRKNRGKDIQIDIEINLEETLQDQTKEIILRKYILCSRCEGKGAEPKSKIKECFSCRGSGEVQQIKRTFLGSFTRNIVCPECNGEGQRPEKFCNVCQGEGRIKGEERIKIFIPAGVDSNQIIKIKGKGDAGKRMAEPGDLYIRIRIKPHPKFIRRGDDIYYTLPISFTQAALGGEVEIPTLEKGKILLKVPAGTDSGKIFRISGEGIPHFSGRGKGNLYVKLIIKTPKKLNKKQKELLKELKKEGI